MRHRWLWMLLSLLVVPLPVQAGKVPLGQLKASDLLPLLTGGTTDALAGSIRGYLVRSMPHPLYEQWKDWGRTSSTARGLRWRGLRPEIQYKPKKDGRWQHWVVVADRPADTLVFDIRNLRQPESGCLRFDVYCALDARVLYEQQTWENGIRLYAGSAQARFRIQALLACELTYRVQLGSLLLPEAVVRLRVTQAQVGYDQFVTEHLAGLGGAAAKVLGDAIRGGLHQWHPTLERDLLAKASAAIEKSADTKEVRLSLQELLKKKGWLSPAPVKPKPSEADN